MAVILSSVPQAIAAEVLASMPLELQTDVVYRIANLSEVPPDIMRQIEDMLKANLQYQKGPKVGGIDVAADLLSHLDPDLEKSIMGSLSNTDSEMAERIADLMFTYDDIITITDISIQRLIQQLDENDLLMALKASTESIKAKFLNNMSQRRRETTEEDLKDMPPVKLKDALAAQRKILSVVKQLDQSGVIEIIREKDDEDYV
jgi:flagellar motor switch protein FliG